MYDYCETLNNRLEDIFKRNTKIKYKKKIR